MIVYDTFPLRDELDLLACRLEELDDVVDWFVIVEATVTHGEREPKPLHFAEHAQRFARWLPRIRYVIADDLPEGEPWAREHAQREQCARGLWDARPDDLVLHGDVDEIPSSGAVRAARQRSEPCAVAMKVHHFAVDWRHPQPDAGTIAVRFRDVDGFHSLCRRRRAMPRIDGGWHFSKLGHPVAQARHVRWGCHLAESQADGSYDTIASGRAYREGWQAGVKLDPVDVDETWPAFIHERRCPSTWFRPREALAA